MVEWKGVAIGVGVSILIVLIMSMVAWNMAIKQMNRELQSNPKLRKELVTQMKDALTRYESALDNQVKAQLQ